MSQRQELNTEIGKRVRQARIDIGFDHKELARRVDLSRPSIVNIERGRRGLDVWHLLAFASALGVSPLVLLGLTEGTVAFDMKREREAIDEEVRTTVAIRLRALAREIERKDGDRG